MMRCVLRLIGYWWSHEEPHFPHPAAFVDKQWDAGERARLAAYLRAGIEYAHYRGYSHCSMPDGPPSHEMGAREMTDGTWAWPEGLAMYVERYAVRLPEEFVSHARANGFRIPTDLDAGALAGAVVETAWWEEWSRTHGRTLSPDATRE